MSRLEMVQRNMRRHLDEVSEERDKARRERDEMRARWEAADVEIEMLNGRVEQMEGLLDGVNKYADKMTAERDGARRLANEAIEEAAELANVIELICNSPGDHCPGEEIGGEGLVQCQGHEGRCVAHWVEIYRGLGRGEK